jgi:hypothetical protein
VRAAWRRTAKKELGGAWVVRVNRWSASGVEEDCEEGVGVGMGVPSGAESPLSPFGERAKETGLKQ